MVTIAEFADPRLAAIYDTINTHEPTEQPRFYEELAREIGAATIIDLGCGTGLITGAFARQGYRMTGVEPSPAMLARARLRPDAHLVRWIGGGAEAIGMPEADLAIMTSHVAQFFVDDAEWASALVALHAALRPGGVLAFESRNPEARGWEVWTPAHRETAVDPVVGPVEWWCEVHDVAEGVVTYSILYRFTATDEVLRSDARLRFRSEVELTASLAVAGFTVERIEGDWDHGPVGPTAPELIVVASR